MPRAPDPDEILEIGRISKLRPEIDQAHSDSTDTISDQMKKRMSVIDLIPCIFNVDYSNILNTDQAVADRFKPTMSFEKPVKDYRSICKTYGLKPYSFLRLYLTDMTSVTDDFNNEYMKSVIDDAIGSLTGSKLGQLFSGLQKTSYSMGTGSPNTIIDNLKDASNSMGIQVSQNLLDNLNLTADVLTHGTRIAFPKIWNSASYTPNLSCDIKLVSPYGHPKAIHEFIIKPISYLLILLSPTTRFGITTERPNYITLKSYGLSNLTLCFPKSISIRRGGDESSYNIYKQPLSVSINLMFEAVTEGFACFKNFETIEDSYDGSELPTHPEGNIFLKGSEIGLKDFQNDYDLPGALFPTLKSIVNSFRPFGFQQTDPQGSFTQPTDNTTIPIVPIPTGSSDSLNNNSTVPEISTDVTEKIDNSVSITPPLDAGTTSEKLSLTNIVEPPIIDVEVISDTQEIISSQYDLNNFISDSVFESIVLDDGAFSLTLTNDFQNTDESILIRARNITQSVPGVWSEYILIHRNDIISDEIQFSVLINPIESSFNNDTRWELIDLSTAETYGPYIGVTDNVKSIPEGDYQLNIIDLSGNVLKELQLEINSENTSTQVLLDEDFGSLLINLNIPEDYDLDDFTYFLISDNGETNFNDNIDLTEDITIGKYYIVIKYRNEIIEYFDGSVLNYIEIETDTLKTLNCEISEVDNVLKITSVNEV